MSLLNFLRENRKRKSIGLYITRLKPILTQSFGKKDNYTPSEVQSAARQARLRMGDLRYGIALYCTPTDFGHYRNASEGEFHLWEIRWEIGGYFFGGNAEFTREDVEAWRRSRLVSPGSDGIGGPDDH